MAIAFYNPISEDFYKKLHNSCDLEEKIDVSINNIHEFLSIINTFHGICKRNLERCQVRLFFEGLESYCFLRKNFIDLYQKYPVSVRDCISCIENRYFLTLPRPHSHSK